MSTDLPASLLESLSESDSVSEFTAAVRKMADHLEFAHVQVTTIVLESRPAPVVVVRTAGDVTELDRGMVVGRTGPNLRHDDPVVKELRRSIVPIVWDQGTYTKSGFGDFHDAWLGGSDFETGIAVRLSLPTAAFSRPVHVLVGMQRRQRILSSQRCRLAADFALLALHAQAGVDRVVLPQLIERRGGESPLTPTMKEYLRWVDLGKTVKETAAISGRSSATIKNTLQMAVDRIGAANKAHAAQIAKEKGWL